MKIPENDVSCAELVELVTEYVEGVMPEEERARFESHVGYCDACENYVEQMRRTIQAVGHITESDLAPDAREALLHAFRDWRKR